MEASDASSTAEEDVRSTETSKFTVLVAEADTLGSMEISSVRDFFAPGYFEIIILRWEAGWVAAAEWPVLDQMPRVPTARPWPPTTGKFLLRATL